MKMTIPMSDIFDHLAVSLERSSAGFSDFLVEITGDGEAVRCRCDRESAKADGADRIAQEVLDALAKKDERWEKYDKEYLSKMLQANLKFFSGSSQILKLVFVTEALK